jgi:neuropeptide Y receptor
MEFETTTTASTSVTEVSDELSFTEVSSVLSRLQSSDQEGIEKNMSELLKRLEHFTHNKAIDDTSLISLLIFYAILIVFGVTGNGLVCAAVARKPSMRTGRNVYIINLAISDLLLCIFTMPFSLVEIALKYWPLGGIMCKLVAGMQATSIFVSAISITAIALDRYRVIVNPTRQSCHPLKTVITLTAIWTFALILASPLFFFRTVETISLEYFDIKWLKSVDYCIENWPLEHGRAFYSIFSMVFQYVIPILIVTVVSTSFITSRDTPKTPTTQNSISMMTVKRMEFLSLMYL